jgi:hypothetical protein
VGRLTSLRQGTENRRPQAGGSSRSGLPLMVQRKRHVLRGYAFRAQRAMMHTYAIIITPTLNTIRYSIFLSHCLTHAESGVSALGTMSRSTHAGQG